ncbi:MAG TPA: putative toxin-antitoxin system toxin component, PIN family [Candidatus Angelobacter sp.]
MRVVLDSNIIVSACLTPEGAPATIVELALLGVFTCCVSRDVIAEYREVLSRPKFSRHSERIEVILEGIEEISEIVSPESRLTVSPDEEDNRLLECALAGKADVLVTGNQKHFPERLDKTRILSPRAFLTELGF